MRLLALVTAVTAFTALISCGGSGPPQIEACAEGASARTATESRSPREPFVGLLRAAAGSAAMLARFDPLSLRAVSPQVQVDEYHDAWSLSPDGAQLALGVSSGRSVLSPSRPLRARIGIYIVDMKTMELVREVQTGVAAQALAWVGRRQLVAALQRGGTVLVDPLTGRTTRRWPGFSFPDASAPTREGLVMLFPQLRSSGADLPLTRVSGSARLAVVDARERLRSLTLKRIPLAVHASNGISYEDRAGLAVDRAHQRAYVAGADAPVAEIDLLTRRVSYHLELAVSERNEALVARHRRALWLGGQIAIFGRDLAATEGGKLIATPAGVTLIDTSDWSACTLDARATGATLGADRVLTYGPGSAVSRDEAGVGLRAFTVGGAEVFHLFEGQRVSDVQVSLGLAYVRTPDAVQVVDVRSGRVIGKISPPPELVILIAGGP
jgi:hypothetical protein